MANYNNETNLGEDEHDDLDDFIVEREDSGKEGNYDVNVEDDGEQDQDLTEVEEEEEEEEEEHPVGQQEILSLRERLKADLRVQYQANVTGSGKAISSSSTVQAPVGAKFGNFFGPSKPSLASRLIEAGSSSILREVHKASSRKGFAAPGVAPKTQPNASAHQEKPKIYSDELRKVDMLRQNRDYSDLFSDDADIPATNEQPNSSRAVMKSEVEVGGPMQSAGKSKVPTNQPGRTLKQHGSIQSRVENKVGSLGKKPLPNGKKMIAPVRNGSSTLPGIRKYPGLQPSSNGQNLQRSKQGKRQQVASPAGQRQQQPSQPSSQTQRQQKHGPQSQVLVMNSSSMILSHKDSDLPLHTSKLADKQLCPTTKANLHPKYAVHRDDTNKKSAVERKCSRKDKAILMIREMFNYNPEKFSGRDEDDRDMEVDYRSIQKEERRSARLGKKEDEEQLRLIEEEERRKRAKKRKQ